MWALAVRERAVARSEEVVTSHLQPFSSLEPTS
jgi:hypothetical protein